MSLAGQCPVCQRSFAFTEADSEDAARSLSCPDCGTRLQRRSIDSVTEIETRCVNCDGYYVVDRFAAGEQLPCRCGATVLVPTVLLVPAEPPAPDVRFEQVETHEPDKLHEPDEPHELHEPPQPDEPLELLEPQEPSEPDEPDETLALNESGEPDRSEPRSTALTVTVSRSEPVTVIATSVHTRRTHPVRIKRPKIPMLGRLATVASLFALVAGGAVMFVLLRGELNGSADRDMPTFPDRPAVPIPVSASAGGATGTPTAVAAIANETIPQGPIPMAAVTTAKTSADRSGGLSSFLKPVQAIAGRYAEADELGRQQLHRFADALGQLGDRQSELTVDDLFWIAEMWEQFARRAASQELASRCLWQSAAAFAFAATVDGITPHDREIATRRQQELSDRSAELLRMASQVKQATTKE
jgi:hypothetical protein